MAKVKKWTTLKELAKACDLSVSTVSKIINNKDNFCSKEKRDKVLRLAKELHYKPNIGYRIMTGMPTNIAAVVFSQKRLSFDEHFLKLSMLLTCAMEQQGYAVYIVNMAMDAEDNLAKIRELETRGCRNFVFIGSPIGESRIEDYIIGQEYNYMTLNYYQSKKGLWLGEECAVREYIQMLKKAGRRNYRLVYDPNLAEQRLFPIFSDDERSDCSEHIIYLYDEPTFENGRLFAEKRFSELSGLDGVIFSRDSFALGAAQYLTKRGLEVGKDIWLFGMYNTNAVQYTVTPIISCDFSWDNVVNLILDHLKDRMPFTSVIKPEIVKNY